MVEHVGNVEYPGIELVDLFVNLRKVQRTQADFEKIVLYADALVRQDIIADKFDFMGGFRQPFHIDSLPAFCRLLQPLQLGDHIGVVALKVTLGEKPPLNFAAGGFGNALYRQHMGDFKPGLFVDKQFDLLDDR